MNWSLFWQLLATAVVAFSGAWLAHTLAASRDLKNKRRDQRISFLIEAYRHLEFGSNRPELADLQRIECAVADIQLFGTPGQIQSAQAFVTEFATTKSASLDAILTELRNDLRAELQLESVPDNLFFLRYHSNSR